MIQQEGVNLKMNDLEFIKRFSKITVKGACERAGVNSPSNLFADRVAKDKVHQVKMHIYNSVLNLLQDDVEADLVRDAKLTCEGDA